MICVTAAAKPLITEKRFLYQINKVHMIVAIV